MQPLRHEKPSQHCPCGPRRMGVGWVSTPYSAGLFDLAPPLLLKQPSKSNYQQIRHTVTPWGCAALKVFLARGDPRRPEHGD